MSTRSTRSRPSASTSKGRTEAATAKLKSNSRSKPADNSDTEMLPSEQDEASDAYEEPSDGDVQPLDSDALDDDSEVEETSTRKRKRRVKSPLKKSSTKKGSPKKRKKKNYSSDEAELELKEGQEVVGTVVQAPKTGRGASSSS
jgi:hypothetical protein